MSEIHIAIEIIHCIANPASRLKKAELIPTGMHSRANLFGVSILLTSSVIDEFLPAFLLDVKWSSDEYADLGNTLKPKKLQDAPSISLKAAPESLAGPCGANMTYVITLTDPDAPSRDDPEWSEMCHWIMAGISASSSSCEIGALVSTEEIMPYKPPGPPKKTGKHRYAFLVFVPANGTTDSLNLTKPDDRQHWGTGQERHGVRDWANENGLAPVGRYCQSETFYTTANIPSAANFIYAQHKKQ